jgi:hypothetical protein
VGSRWSRRLRSSPPSELPGFTRHPHMLCRRFPRLPRQRAREGMFYLVAFLSQYLIRVVQWISEVMHFCAGLPIILVGCKKDLRRDPKTVESLRKTSQRPVTPEEVRTSRLIPMSWRSQVSGHGCCAEDRCQAVPGVFSQVR